MKIQKLDFITPGLSLNGNLSFDNHFESERGIRDNIGVYPTKWIDPVIEDMGANGNPTDYIVLNPVSGKNQFDYVQLPWTVAAEDATSTLSSLRRRLFYQVQANYSRMFGKHDITATAVFNRDQSDTGSEFQHFRED
ncbi:MAG: hypothetical protein PHR83_15445 [Paludibacter sp.]|nr:hypothetical protein [Paludibacter sp.]